MKFDLGKIDVPIPLTPEYVLSEIDELLIFRYYLGTFKLDTNCKNPFREEKHPSFCVFVGKKDLKLMWKDFGTGKGGDCFKLVSEIFNISYFEAVKKVAEDFGVGSDKKPNISKKQLEEVKQFRDNFKRKEYLIQVQRRAMTKTELAYWAQYGLNREDLLSNNIYGIEKLWVNKNQIIYKENDLRFAYYFPEVDKWKIYSPFSSQYKWFGNVSTHQMEGVESLVLTETDGTPGKSVIITKSRKDRMILKKLYPNVCSCQNESEGAIPREMDPIFDMAQSKYCWFDSDEPGKNANRKLNHRGYKWINVPNELYQKYELKDPSDVIKHFGWEKGSEILKNELKKKGLW